MYGFIPDLPLNFTMCLSMLCSLLFDSTLEIFEFRWSITGLILRALSVLSFSLLPAKCRFWRISEKRFRIILFWMPSLPIRLSIFQCSAIVGDLFIAITKFITRNASSSSSVTAKFLFEAGHQRKYFCCGNCFF